MIPKIIHQTHKTKILPEIVTGFPQILKDLHFAWDYRFYDDPSCRYHIHKFVPELLPLYDRLPNPIMKSDMFRVGILYIFGGFYFDTDVYFHEAIDELLVYEAVLATESILDENALQSFGHKDAVRIANYGFGFEPGHLFLRYLIMQWLEMGDVLLKVSSRHEVLESTGPGFLTNVFHQIYKDVHPGLKLLDLGDRKCQRCEQFTCQFGKYASHYHFGNWDLSLKS